MRRPSLTHGHKAFVSLLYYRTAVTPRVTDMARATSVSVDSGHMALHGCFRQVEECP